MKKQADITFQDKTFILTGDLDYSNVVSLYQKSLSQLRECPALEFDFSRITSSDSAGLALVMEWMKWAKKHSKPIHFTHLSQDLMAIAKVAGIAELIPAHH